MSARQLEDRIRDLCARAATASDAQIAQILKELQEALQEHTRQLRKMAADKLISRTPQQE